MATNTKTAHNVIYMNVYFRFVGSLLLCDWHQLASLLHGDLVGLVKAGFGTVFVVLEDLVHFQVTQRAVLKRLHTVAPLYDCGHHLKHFEMQYQSGVPTANATYERGINGVSS